MKVEENPDDCDDWICECPHCHNKAPESQYDGLGLDGDLFCNNCWTVVKRNDDTEIVVPKKEIIQMKLFGEEV
jgi:hypothetical protein